MTCFKKGCLELVKVEMAGIQACEDHEDELYLRLHGGCANCKN